MLVVKGEAFLCTNDDQGSRTKTEGIMFTNKVGIELLKIV
jgi:hypothetical protein